MNTAAIRTAARIARFSIIRPVASSPAVDRTRRDGTDGSAPDATPRDRRRVRDHTRRSPASRTPSTSARTGTPAARAARRATGRRAELRARLVSRCSRARAWNPCAWNPGQRVVELTGQLRERLPQCGGAADDHERRVRGRGVPHRAIRLAETAPGAVSMHGAADLSAHGKAGAARLGRRTPEYDHGRPINSLALLEERLKFSAGGQPFASRKPAGQTVSRFRPFARRRLRTFRPPLVFIRSRKP